jgi:hypothetical protein
MLALINVRGTDLPTPSGYSVGVQDIVKFDRNANGDAIGERIAIKTKIELSWKTLTAAQVSTVLSLFQSSFFFTVIYMDPVLNANKTATFYVGDRKTPMLDFISGVPRYKDIGFNLIQK